jgi:hypothetical protein
MSDENTGWITGQVGKISKTTNGGLNWFAQDANAGTHWIINIDMLNENTGFISGDDNIRKTTNGGENWVTINSPLPGTQFHSMDFIDEDNGILIFGSGCLKTYNSGSSWIIENIGASFGITLGTSSFANTPAVIMLDPDTIVVSGLYSNILKYSPQPPIGITEWYNSVSKEFSLSQNYPNPFNPTTTIKFAIPRQSKVLLKVYDVIGKEVRTIVDMELSAGTVTHQFDGSRLASGIYFYSLYIDGSLMDTKKMVLVK